MARAEFKGRQFAIYLPTAEYLEIWKQRAKAANCSLNSYIFEAVESLGERPTQTAGMDEINKLRAENQELKAEIERFRSWQSNLFKIDKTKDTFQPMPFKKALINALRGGGYWTSEKINRKFRMYIEGEGANPGKIIDENEDGYDGLIPRYAGGRPSKLSAQQKEKLLLLLKGKDIWPTDKVRFLILKEFGVEYTLKQVRVIVKKFDIKYAKPFTFDYRKPPNAEIILKKHTTDRRKYCCGFSR